MQTLGSDQLAGWRTLSIGLPRCRLLLVAFVLVCSLAEIAVADVPAAPSDLAAEVVSATKTRLTWHDNSDNETWFQVVVCPPQGAFFTRCLSFGLPANTTAFTIDDPVLSECQFVDVYAWNSDGKSEPSDTIELFFLDEPSLVATAASADRIDLAWDDASRCEDGYEVWRAYATGGGLTRMDRIAILPPNTATYADVSVAVIHMYAYRVYVVHGETQQALSNLVWAIAYAPANLVATPVTATRIDLAWEDGIDYEDGYTIERSNWSWGELQWGPWAVIANEPANTTSYTDDGLASGSLHRYRVRAYWASALSAWSDIATAMAVAVPPLPPSDLTASSVSSNRIDLTWQDNSNDETKFKIERKPQGGTYSQIATVEADVTTFSSTGLSPATTYCYRVRAYSNAGNSAYSDKSCATTSAVPPIGPSDLAAAAVLADRIDITWHDNSSDEIGFKIGRRPSGGTFSQIAVVGANTTSYSSTGLSPGTTYCYLVMAYNAAGNSTPSNEACAETLPGAGPSDDPPDAPNNLSAAAASASRIDITWVENSDDEIGFKIGRKPEDGVFAQIAVVGANTAGYSDAAGLSPDTEYCYLVLAYNAAGNSNPSNESCATTSAVPPNGPSNLAASAVSSSRIDLTWQDNSNNETGFRIERGPQGGGYGEIATVGANTTSYSNTGLVAGTTYCYRVRAYNAVDNSEYCTEACAIAHAPYLVAVAAGSSRIDLTWDDALSEDGYTVQRRMHATGVGWGGWVGIATEAANTTSYEDTAVASGGLYQYRVRAYAGEAESAWSNEATASAIDLPPNPPTGLTATAVSSTEIDLTWQDNADNEEGFEVERAADGGGYTIVAVVGPDAPGYSDTALTVDTWYCYRVHACSAVGDSDASNEACATTSDRAPSAPDSMTWSVPPYAVGLESVAMTATTASDPSGVEYYFEETTGNPGGDDSGWQDGPGYTDGGLQSGTEYCYRVAARDKSPSWNQTGWSSLGCASTDIRGDINGDGAIDLIDALMLYRYASGVLSLLPEAIARADIDGDGDVDMADAEALADIVFGT